MAKRISRRQDPIVRMIDDALQPDWSWSQYEASSVVSELQRAEAEIAKLVGSEPARAVALYETLLEACDATVEEIDDSDGEIVVFAGGLYLGWIKARQAAGADAAETARLLLKFIDEDNYGFCDGLVSSAAEVLDRAGLDALAREARSRLDKARIARDDPKRPKQPNPNYYLDRWGGMLKTICLHRGAVQEYIDLTEFTELTKVDCHAIATMFQAKRKPEDALAWVERGLSIGKRRAFEPAGYQLSEMRRALLTKLGRGREALNSAWAEFQAYPGKSTWEVLMRYVPKAPKAERAAWREKAMDFSERGELDSVIELWLAAKETERLARRLENASDGELESLSHYTTEPAARRLAKTHPGVAAKVFRALCMRVVDEGKSQYYFAALSNLEKAKNCYRSAGLDAQWRALVSEIRRKHHRKSGFMPGFERIAGGAGSRKARSFAKSAPKR